MYSISPILKHSLRRVACVSLLALSTAAFSQDNRSDEKVEFSADHVTFDTDNKTVTAKGRVHLEREGYKLDAGEITYNEETGEIEASGAVTLITPSGDKIYAPRMALTDNLKKTFIEDVRLLMTDGAQVRAKSASRDEVGNETSLDRAVYSPCKICAGETDQTPLWQIKAVKVVHNKEKRRLYYTDAILEVFGLPVLWTPKFSHPDPTVDKASGVLPLNIKTTRNLGFYLGVPYHWVINDSQDLTVTPTVTSKEGFLVDAEYRQHVGSGQFRIAGSITRGNKNLDRIFPVASGNGQDVVFSGTGNDTIIVSPGDIVDGRTVTETTLIRNNKGFRGHFMSDGQFNHSKNWRSTYQINIASDDTYLRRYDFSETDTLINEYMVEGFFDRSYVSARTIAFQGLRVEDVAGQSAFAAPLIDAEFIPSFKPLGGTLSLKGNAVALFRTSGQDTQRVSVSANWRKRWITGGGLVFDADAELRTDLYNISDAVTATDVVTPRDEGFTGSFATNSQTEWRNLARLTTSVSYPFVKYGRNGTHVLEPIVQATASPNRGILESIVNEDSRAFELNDLNIFSGNRSSGYDVWEDGSHITYGLRWRYDGSDLTTDIMFGQTLRLTGDFAVTAVGVGLEGDFSNFVGRTSINYKGWLDIEHRYRLNETDFSFVRNDVDVTVGDENKSIRVGYLKLNRGLSFSNREDREEIRTSAFYKVSNNWKLHGSFTRRLKGAVIGGLTGIDEGVGNIEYSVGASYENECIDIGLTVRRNYTQDRDIQPGTSILFRLRLTNLG